MLSLVEEYAEKKVLKATTETAMKATIEAYVDVELSEETVVSKLMEKFNLTQEKAKEYYDMFALQPVKKYKIQEGR